MGKTVEKKRKKKGRPSLLELQKRSLRLQKQQEEEEQLLLQQQQAKRNPNPSPNPSSNATNPYLRFPASSNPARRTTRRNPNASAVEVGDDEEGEDDDDDDDEEEAGGKRKEKKLKLVLRLPQGSSAGEPRRGLDLSGSESEGDGRARLKKRSIDAVGGGGSAGDKIEKQKPSSKATEASQGEPSDLEPLTPLPDKKLLVFILDRLQKKDTYGVFSEPVDPEELPDYHDIIEHPMDFSTIRKKLSCGAYANLEQFEKDVFLISSNAMRYNAPDTIYFRQARSIQELAKKDFENLRQESDDNEPEQKIVRRGRPPTKSAFKKPVGRPAAEHALSNMSSDATLPNAADKALWSNSSIDTRKGSASDKYNLIDSSTRVSQGLRNSEIHSWLADQKSERAEESSGSVMKGISTRYGKKATVLEENRRNTYKQPPSAISGHEPSILTTFDGEKKELVPSNLNAPDKESTSFKALPFRPLGSLLRPPPRPSGSCIPYFRVGLHMEHAYARSLARFAANLGPVGWEFAAKQIERVLPSGMKFGRGWVGENDAPQPYQPPILSVPSLLSQSTIPPCPLTSEADKLLEKPEPLAKLSTIHGNHPSRSVRPPSPLPAISNKPSDAVEVADASKGSAHESGIDASGGEVRPKVPFQLQQNSLVQHAVNGLNAGSGFNLSPVGAMARPARPTVSSPPEVPTTHGRVLDMVSRGNNSFMHLASTSHSEAERPKFSNPSMVNSFNSFFHPPVPSQQEAARAQLAGSSKVNSVGNFLQPAGANHLEVERARSSNPGTVNSGNGFGYQAAAGHLEADRSKLPSQNTGNPVNRFLHPAAITSHVEAERSKFSNPNPVNYGNTFVHSAMMNHLEAERAKSSSTNATNSGNSFAHHGSTGHFEVDRSKLGNPTAINPAVTTHMEMENRTSGNTSISSSGRIFQESAQESQGPWRGLSLHQKSDSAPPDLNVRFQSPGSPASGVVVDTQQPDLALQL